MLDDEALINGLPEEVLEYILSLVSPYGELESCKLVCKKWLELVQGILCRCPHSVGLVPDRKNSF